MLGKRLALLSHEGTALEKYYPHYLTRTDGLEAKVHPLQSWGQNMN